jgi:integrase/recombinase XerD
MAGMSALTPAEGIRTPVRIPGPDGPLEGVIVEASAEEPTDIAIIDRPADTWPEATARWLRRKRPRTAEAYLADVQGWCAFLDRRGVGPLQALKRDADDWAIELEGQGQKSVSVARRMSAVSSWYRYLVASELTDRNPMGAAERPPVDRHHSPTRWLTEDEARRFLAAVDADARTTTLLRNRAIVRVMLAVGVRVTEVTTLTVGALGHQGSQRTITVTGKGGKTLERALPAVVADAVDAYLAQRREREGRDPDRGALLFVTDTGGALDRHNIAKQVRRWAAAAGIPDADRISPHSLRHSFAVITTERGASLDQLQAAMGHADPRTTRRYQHSVNRLETDPAHLAAAALG